MTNDRRQALREQQSRGLKRLLKSLGQNRFYADKLAAAGVDLRAVRGIEDLTQLPFTTKEELQRDQEKYPPFGTNLSFPLENYTRLHHTSGTSGQRLTWLDTPESWDWVVRCWDNVFGAAGVGANERFFIPFSYGPFLGFWSGFEAAARNRHLTIAGGGMTSAGRLGFIVDCGITAIATTPTYALRLAEVAEEQGCDLARTTVRVVIVAGEPGGSIPEVRSRIEEAWGAGCSDHWGMTEVGPLGFEPLERPGGVHLLESDCIAEVIEPQTGALLEGGGRGELVITTFERLASPLIRYRTGDLVEFSIPVDSAPAGEARAVGANLRTGFPFIRLEGGILGRVDQMVLIRGNNVYPSAIDALLRQFDGIAEYRAEVIESRRGTRLRLLLEPRDDAQSSTDRLVSRVTQMVKERLFFTPEVRLAPKGSLPRFEFKSRRFVQLTE